MDLKAMKEQYDRDGYAVVPDMFTDKEVQVMQAELNRLTEAGLLRNVSTAGDGQTEDTGSRNLQICPLSPRSEVFRMLPFAAKVRERVFALLGDEVFLQLDQIFLKPPRHGSGTNWHQDNAYFGIDDPTQGVGMWVALHDATVANGTMHIVPRSHERVFDHARDPNSNHHICCVVDEEHEDVRPIEMRAGGALFFNYGIAHCTKANRTDAPRAGLALHFLRGEYREPAGAKGPVRPWIGGAAATDGAAEWGAGLAGAWERTVAAA